MGVALLAKSNRKLDGNVMYQTLVYRDLFGFRSKMYTFADGVMISRIE